MQLHLVDLPELQCREQPTWVEGMALRAVAAFWRASLEDSFACFRLFWYSKPLLTDSSLSRVAVTSLTMEKRLLRVRPFAAGQGMGAGVSVKGGNGHSNFERG